MHRDGSITMDWPDGERRYRLAIGQLKSLQEVCGVGPLALLRRLSSGNWMVQDVVETIRLGAIGGGASIEQARAIIRDSVEQRPWLESVPHALAILSAALVGPEDETIEEAPGNDTPDAKKAPPKRTRRDASASRSSTATAPSLAGHPATSTR